ncbi:MAG TPA: universal stress protein [Chthonomonadales bacterium]|nr:universal stress protein [Chthonomonadales bacterium]
MRVADTMADDERRPSPEEVLERVTRMERQRGHGRLKVFLGYAAGVGKTYEMLSEAHRRRRRGQDVVIAYVETHGRQGTADLVGDLEIVPRKRIEYRGSVLEEMDVEAVIRRGPQYALVDELAHTNAPGSEREKRWQDVQALLDAGISVLSTLNVQHLESLNDTVHGITGIWVRETVPDHVVGQADEIEMVDATPRALINRLERGDIYSHDKVPLALRNWFREGNLHALREIALREVAHEVDEDVASYRRERHIDQAWATQDRVMVCIGPSRPSLRLIRRGWRIAQRLEGEVVAVYVESRPPGAKEASELRDSFALAERLRVPVVTLHGRISAELIRYARENRITQIVVGHSSRSRLAQALRGSIIADLFGALRNIDILIVAALPEDPAG